MLSNLCIGIILSIQRWFTFYMQVSHYVVYTTRCDLQIIYIYMYIKSLLIVYLIIAETVHCRYESSLQWKKADQLHYHIFSRSVRFALCTHWIENHIESLTCSWITWFYSIWDDYVAKFNRANLEKRN